MSGGGRGRGGGGGGGGAVTKGPIADSVKKTISTIREITGKQHTDDDIYLVLKDCDMDPNETTQKLLHIDTFHEVKSKRDRKKEVAKEVKVSGSQGRGSRGGRGNSSSNHIYTDVVGRKNGASRKENVANHHNKEKGYLPVLQKISGETAIKGTKETKEFNGSSNLSNGSLATDHCPQSPVKVAITNDGPVDDAKKPAKASAVSTSPPPYRLPGSVQVQKGKAAPILNHLPIPTPASVSGVHSSAVDTVSAPLQGNKEVASAVDVELSKNGWKPPTVTHSLNQKKIPSESHVTERNDELSKVPFETNLAVRFSSGDNHSPQQSPVPSTVCEDSSLLSTEKTVPNGHVIFPNHFKVPEALKSGLSFGSFDISPGVGPSCYGNGHEANPADPVESSLESEGAAEEPPLSNQTTSSAAVQVDHPEQPESPQQLFDELHKSDDIVAPDSKSDKPTQEVMSFPDGHQNPAVHIASLVMPGYAQYEGLETQSGNRTASSGPSPSLSPNPIQNSLAAPQQPIFYRPSFPNYVPVYYSPYVLQTMPFLSHNGLPQQPGTGNPFVNTAASAPSVKLPPQFKPGTSTGMSTPPAIQTLYGPFGSAHIGFNPGPAVTAASNEDLSASQLKESQIYTTGPLNEVSAWIPAPGQEIAGLNINPMYHHHVNPQGPLAYPHLQPAHPAYTIYSQMQTIAAPSNVHPLLQQTQPLSATPETIGPSPVAYQPAQLAQMNWNSGHGH